MKTFHPTDHSPLITAGKQITRDGQTVKINRFEEGMNIKVRDVPPGYPEDHVFTVLETTRGGAAAFILPIEGHDPDMGAHAPSGKNMWLIYRGKADSVEPDDKPTM